MKWTWKLLRVGRIDINVHATFWMLLVWVAASAYLEQHRWEHALGGLLLVAILFSIVVLHELGHAFMARQFGIRTLDITLLPLGGVSRLERIPEVPLQEMLVAIAGPAVNVMLAALLLIVLLVLGEVPWPFGAGPLAGGLFAHLIWINVSLAAFNLIPAFPMDGGRVLRALLALRVGSLDATRIAARVGRSIALLLGLLGLLFNPLLVLIALFVWIGAGQEARASQVRGVIADASVDEAMVKDFHTLAPRDSLGRAIDRLLSGSQRDFPVADGERLVGVLTRADLLNALSQRSIDRCVEDVMHRRFETCEPREKLERALERLNRSTCSMPVLREGRIVGLLTAANVDEFVATRAALSRARPRTAASTNAPSGTALAQEASSAK